MKDLKVILKILLILISLSSCVKSDDKDGFRYDTEVIAVFSSYGVSEHTHDGLIYKGLIKATDSLGIVFRPVIPFTYEDGTNTIDRLIKSDQSGKKRLIISADPEYSDYLSKLASDGGIIDSDSTKLLVFDGDLSHPDLYAVHVPLYAVMYEAGYLAGRMDSVNNARIYIANDNYRYMREGKDGFIDGFALGGGDDIDVVDFSEINDDNREGFYKASLAYLYAEECYNDSCDMVLPVCGETIMGFLRYNREFPGSFYTVGVGADMSVYSPDVPFSCVEHLDRVVNECVVAWIENRLEHKMTFGMDGGWVELIVSGNYRNQLGQVPSEIHRQALEKEAGYER
jgi:basic membrane lipoprotein Med (substrate-binding protein (PBP1-ABC) superfamily)